MSIPRWFRIVRRIALITAISLVAIVAVAIGILHTDRGRDFVRGEVETQLAKTFTGGATIGKLEGSPFGELVLRDITIGGPNHERAIAIGALHLELGLLPLLSHRVRLDSVIVEDLEVHGGADLSQLLAPGPKSTWSVTITSLEIRRGHVSIETGGEPLDIDHVTLDAAAEIPYGKPLDASLRLQGRWRQRATDVDLAALLHVDGAVLDVPVLIARASAGAIGSPQRAAPGSIEAWGLRVVGHDVTGSLSIVAPAATVAQLAPQVQLPGDLAIALGGFSGGGVTLAAWLDDASVRGGLKLDVDTLHAIGVIATTGDLALAPFHLTGTAGGTIAFDVTPAGGRAWIAAHGAVPELPITNATMVIDATRIHASIAAVIGGPDAHGTVTAAGGEVGHAWMLERATVVAATHDAAHLRAPVHGAVSVDLAAHGRIYPDPELAVTGTILGDHVQMPGLAIRSLRVAIDASQLPASPRGKAKVDALDVVAGSRHLGMIAIDAASRPDRRIAIALRARQAELPSLVELDALVTPPNAGNVVIDLQRHRVFFAPTNDWSGTTGHIEIGPERVVVQDLKSASGAGSVEVAGSYARRTGDVTASLDAKLAVDKLHKGAVGKATAHVTAARAHGSWSGDAKLAMLGMSIDPLIPLADGNATIVARPRSVTVDVSGGSALAGMKLALDIEAPADLADVAAWRRLDRAAIRSSKLELHRIDLAKVAKIARLTAEVSGMVDADIAVSATTATAKINAHDLVTPALHGKVAVELDVTEPTRGELAAKLLATLEGVGKLTGTAQLTTPAKLFDPDAWRRLGIAMVRGATVHADDIAFDPALLARFGYTSDLRGKVGFSLVVGPAADTAQLAADVRGLRGSPLSVPVDLALAATLDAKQVKATLAVRQKETTLLDLAAEMPLSGLRFARNAPLVGTVTLVDTSAPQLMAVFGRSELTKGTLKGTIVLGGTLGAPTAHAQLSADDLAVAPRLRAKPLQTVKHLTLDASWDGHAATATIDGSEDAGGKLHLVASVNPSTLSAGSLKLTAEHFDLTPLLALAPGPAGGAAGKLDGQVALAGFDPTTAKVTGELHLLDARIPTGSTIGTLRDARIDLGVASGGFSVTAAGKLGKGTVNITGNLALTGSALTGAHATITLKKVSPIGSIEPVVDAVITATVKHGDTWAVDLSIDKGNIVVPKKGGEELKPVGAPSDMTFANAAPRTTVKLAKRPPPTNPVIVVTIAINNAEIKTEELRGLIDGKLVMTLDGHAIGMTGSIHAERSDLELFGRRYDVERAVATFDGSLDPILDLRVSHDFTEVSTVTEVRGRLSSPELTMSSDPGTYSQGQLLGFLLGGEPSSSPNSAPGRDQVTDAGTSAITGALGGYIKGALPIDIDVLRYENATADTSASVTVGRWITHKWFLAYRQHIDALPDENDGEAEFEYWLNRRVILEGNAGDRGYDGVDLLWRKRY